MVTRTGQHSGVNSSRQWWFMAVLVAAVAGLAVGGAIGALLNQPHPFVAAQQVRGSTAGAFTADNALESRLLTEARLLAQGPTAAQISASTQRAQERVLESRLLNEARAFVQGSASVEISGSAQRAEEKVLESQLINEARLLATASSAGATSGSGRGMTADEILESRLLGEARLLAEIPAGGANEP